jgi:parallel beta-helix repeat protein
MMFLYFLRIIAFTLPLSSPETAFAQSRTLYVDVSGTDSDACGEQQQPCRSIRRAILNAYNGDTILVGPGQYGDVNGDGDFRDPGEEEAEVEVGCHCMININKPLTLISLSGAAATVLNAGDGVQEGVRIQADNASFGQVGKGFTIMQARGSGVVIAKHTTAVHVAGNIIKRNRGAGIHLDGANHILRGNTIQDNRMYGVVIASGKGHEVRQNVITDNRVRGILTFVHEIVVAGNTIEGNDLVAGCGLVNNSQAALHVFGNVWGGTGKSSSGSANKICDLGDSRTIVGPAVEQKSTTPQSPLQAHDVSGSVE